ncbi:histone-lysine N-methyltransferase SETMAR-like [Tachypleus tridentatus]|uniref:histone-lysine N-methyltransferase SETMAR-like n=1 Tax=Tachypleus tridentatus TaxID=6853 RepID=UPI003FD26187
MFYEFRIGKNDIDATRSIQEVYSNDILNAKKCQRWLNKFRTGDCSLTDAVRTVRPLEIDNDLLLTTLEETCAVTVEDRAQKLKSSPSTVHRELQQLGRASKLRKWIPHELSADNLRERVDTYTSLQSQFLNHLVTEDERWVHYQNVKRRRQWVSAKEPATPQSKANLHSKKVFLSVW